MKHWKPRAAAIVILTAALLTGVFTPLNSDVEAPAVALLNGEGGVVTALSRWFATLTGGVPAGEEDSEGESPDEAEDGGGQGDDAGSGVAVTSDGSVVQSDDDDPPGTRPVQIRIGSSGSGADAPAETPLDNVAPNQRIPKDFHVDNWGTQDVYVFMAVTVPYVAIATQKSDGTYVPMTSQPLYTFEANEGWTLLEDGIDGNTITYVYAYASGLEPDAMTALAVGTSTPALFDALLTANYVEGRLDGTQEEVVARAYAIQTRELGEATTPAAIWQLIRNGSR